MTIIITLENGAEIKCWDIDNAIDVLQTIQKDNDLMKELADDFWKDWEKIVDKPKILND